MTQDQKPTPYEAPHAPGKGGDKQHPDTPPKE